MYMVQFGPMGVPFSWHRDSRTSSDFVTRWSGDPTCMSCTFFGVV